MMVVMMTFVMKAMMVTYIMAIPRKMATVMIKRINIMITPKIIIPSAIFPTSKL